MAVAELRPGGPAGGSPAAAWSVRLLGAVEARAGGSVLQHWPTRAVAALLARLALAPHRTHAREELVELLWPGVAPDAGRNRLRQTLFALKSLIERDGEPPVLLADRLSIRVRPGALDCDAVAFEDCVRRGDVAAARACYQGALMPGHYDDWIVAERERLAALHERLGDPAPAPPRAPASVPAPPRGMPSYLTRAFGLEAGIGRLQALVRGERLVTVHGPGGSGKTRLAAAAASALCDGPEAPFELVAFVPLLACSTAAQALEAVAAAIGAAGAVDAATRIHAALAGRTALLVLDNAEQLEPRADAALAALLPALQRLHLVVTSRRLLGIDGEQAFELHGLPLPGPAAGAVGAARNPSVALFVDRARAVRDGFVLADDNVAAVTDIVRLIGGMPLAIELAASRLRSLTPAELQQHLCGSGSATLDLLARHGPGIAADARHASMRQVVAWSWALLAPAQREVMRALSTFGAPARLGAVAAVAGLGDPITGGHLDTLHGLALANRSTDAEHATRWSLLEPVREFAAEQQPAAQARQARARLRRWLIDHVAARMPSGPSAVAAEIAHVHAVIASAAADGAAGEALELAVALRRYWDADALPMSTVRALEDGLAGADVPPALRSSAHELLSFARGIGGWASDAVRHAEAAVATAPDPLRRSSAQARWAWAAYFDGRFDADYDAALEDAERAAEASGDPAALALVLRIRALIVSNLRLDFAQAETLAVRSQALYERAGMRTMAHYALLNRVTMWAWRGRNAEALEAMRELDAALRGDGDWAGLMHSKRQQGRVLIRLRRFGEAVEAFRASVRIAGQQQMTQGLAQGLLHLPEALLHGSDADAEAAARLQGYAVLHWERLYPRLNRIEVRELKRARRMLRRRLGGARAEALMLAGRSLSPPDALALAAGGPA